MSYYNTTGEVGDELNEYEGKARKQESRVLEWFMVWGGQHPPSTVHKYCFGESVPITSVRRAMTNLTKSGLLEKTGVKVVGPYNRPEFCWRLVSRDEVQAELF